MGAPNQSVCSTWATEADLCSPCDDYALDPVLIEDALLIASEILFERSGRRWPGSCTETVRPCAQRSMSITYHQTPLVHSEILGAPIVVCGCGRDSSCSCSGLHAIDFGLVPITAVSGVKVDGVTLGASLYRIDDYRRLVRLPNADGTNPGWPCGQDLTADPDTDDETFEVTITYGVAPPQAGVRAAAALGCWLVQTCQPEELGECAAPRRATSIARQGITITAPSPDSLVTADAFGITEVDMFLTTYNPERLRQAASVHSPDLGRRFTVTNT